MHELSIAYEMLEQVIATANAHGASEVKSVTLQIGNLSHTNPEQLSFCFNAIAGGTIAENAKFVIEKVPPSLVCECGYSGTLDEKELREAGNFTSELLLYVAAIECPVCKKQAQIEGGRELIIKSIEIETEEERENKVEDNAEAKEA